jgi:hypothetical protein
LVAKQMKGLEPRWGNWGGCSSRPAALVRAKNNGIYERKLFIGSKLKISAIQNNILINFRSTQGVLSDNSGNV